MEIVILDTRVKQRLVGALVLLGLVAIVIPIVFHGNSIKPDVVAMSPVVPEPPTDPAVLQIVDEEAQTVKQTQVQLSQQEQHLQAQQSHTIQTHTWTIQIASFRDKALAQELQKKLDEQNILTYIRKEQPAHAKEEYYRLFSGPYPNKAQAESLLTQLQQTTKVTGLLIDNG